MLLGIYLAVQVADFAWYRTHIPASFWDARWSGRWSTERYAGLSGRLLIRLPNPIPEDVDFRVEASVYYPIYSVWRTGRFVRMELLGRFSPDDGASGGHSTNEIQSGGGMLKFKGYSGRQVVEYAAVVNQDRSKIVGGYLSDQPLDHGHFSIGLE